jgi:hypothetical protein
MAGLDVEELSGLPDEKFIAALTAIVASVLAIWMLPALTRE